jgi:phospho-N-acetylmuramoyl-pentapeptide-transferase
MFYHLFYPLHEYFSALNVFRYITFRAAYAAVTALLISFLLGPYVIERLRRLGVGQRIRSDGPQTHQSKSGTPTMGGILIIAATVVPTLLWANLANAYVLTALASIVWLGLIGFVDDYLHAVRGVSKGLLGRYKLAAQLGLGLTVGAGLYFTRFHGDLTPVTQVPFLKSVLLNLGVVYILFVAVVITGSSNAVNFSDGLDGLAIGMVAPAALAFAGLAYVSGNARFASYLNILYLEGAGELTVFCAAMVGASLGFLWFNAHPAEVFMGDTGSLALGGAIGTVAVLIKREFLLAVIGGLFVAEVLSVILQVGSYKLRKGKRIFRMAPLHHHFELLGWPESKVVIRFWIVSVLLALLSLSTLKLQ